MQHLQSPDPLRPQIAVRELIAMVGCLMALNALSIDILLPDGGKQIVQAGDHGLPLADAAAKNPLRKEIQKIAQQLHDIGSEAEAKGKKGRKRAAK